MTQSKIAKIVVIPQDILTRRKLDGVGLVDSKPSGKKLHHFEEKRKKQRKKITCCLKFKFGLDQKKAFLEKKITFIQNTTKKSQHYCKTCMESPQEALQETVYI